MNSAAALKPRSRRGHTWSEPQPDYAATVPIVERETPRVRCGQRRTEIHRSDATTDDVSKIAGDVAGIGGDQCSTAAQRSDVSADLLAAIGDRYRIRRTLVTTAGSLTLVIKSRERGAATFRIRAQGGELKPGKMPVATAADRAIVLKVYPSLFAARAAVGLQQRGEEKGLIKEVERLPVAKWAAEVLGLGPLSLAALVGEAGDPGAYATASRLWKRYGLAVIDGHAQRLVAGADASARQGYSPQRRSALHVIGGNMIRCGNARAREIYDRIKARELAKDGITKMHAHKRALRIVEKELVVAFWLAWRRPDEPPESAMAWCVPAALPEHDTGGAGV